MGSLFGAPSAPPPPPPPVLSIPDPEQDSRKARLAALRRRRRGRTGAIQTSPAGAPGSGASSGALRPRHGPGRKSDLGA